MIMRNILIHVYIKKICHRSLPAFDRFYLYNHKITLFKLLLAYNIGFNKY